MNVQSVVKNYLLMIPMMLINQDKIGYALGVILMSIGGLIFWIVLCTFLYRILGNLFWWGLGGIGLMGIGVMIVTIDASS